MEIYDLERDERTLREAREAWLALAPQRRRRRRLKDFTYGRQWGDPCRTTDGRVLTEEQRMSEEGRVPVTNNIIRQMVKSIIGRYRYMCEKMDSAYNGEELPTGVGFGERPPAVDDLDARALEEFLISGCAIQRQMWSGWENVSPDNFFHHPFYETDGSDCLFMGMLHSLSPAAALRAFAKGDPRRARAVNRALRRGVEVAGPFSGTALGSSFDTPSRPGTYRVIEVWRHVSYEHLIVTDPVAGKSTLMQTDDLERLEGLNRARVEVGTEPLSWKYEAHQRWENVWLTPAGEVLLRSSLPWGKHLPFVLKFYPLIDGEVHSLVEDVVDQQKYVNRLISMLDHIISSSAKGVLLYPAEQLPDGFTWKDVRRIWANPNGILPFKRTPKGTVPQQVNSSGAGAAGAAEMLKLQLQLFDQISGTTGALSGKSTTAQGEGMLRAELENALVSMLDVLASFRCFVLEREAVRPL